MEISSYLTLAGSSHGKMPRFTALQRAQAAHAAGITSIGVLWNENLTPEILRHAEIFEAEWFELSGPLTDEAKLALHVLPDYGCKLIKTGLCGTQTPVETAAANLGQLVTAASREGLTVAVEPVAWSAVPSLGGTLAMMSLAGVLDHPSVGICYDLWQVAKGTPYGQWFPEGMRIAKAEVSGITYPGDWVKDGLPDLPLITQAMNRPLIPDSDIDIAEWVSMIRKTGFTGPVTHEVPNVKLRDMSLEDAALAAAKDMEAL